jgi:hypothetical protein
MSKSFVAGFGLVIAGLTCGTIEKMFYVNRLDEYNVVQESFFLPLSIFLTLTGFVMLAFVAGRFFVKRVQSQR